MTNQAEVLLKAMQMRAGAILLQSEEQTLIKMQGSIMRIKMAAYTEARFAGFTEEQAFELAKQAV